MNLDKYPVTSSNDRKEHRFFSKGPCGIIAKAVLFQNIVHDFYNMVFGDWNEAEQVIDDNVRSNNSDMDKVIATVASTVLYFLEYYPKAIIYVKGSTPARTRLYQIKLSANWYTISPTLIIEGLINGAFQPFERQKNYRAFSVRVKQKL